MIALLGDERLNKLPLYPCRRRANRLLAAERHLSVLFFRCTLQNCQNLTPDGGELSASNRNQDGSRPQVGVPRRQQAIEVMHGTRSLLLAIKRGLNLAPRAWTILHPISPLPINRTERDACRSESLVAVKGNHVVQHPAFYLVLRVLSTVRPP